MSDTYQWKPRVENNPYWWWYINVKTQKVLAVVHTYQSGWIFEINYGSNANSHISAMYVTDVAAKAAAELFLESSAKTWMKQ